MYKAVVSKIYVTPHPDPEVHSIAVGVACNNTVIVSNKVQTGELGVYFECDGQLSLDFCKQNKLLREDGGYFDENRRVRAQKFRGVRSDGFWIPVDSVAFTGVSVADLKEGDTFDSLKGVQICSKYETAATRSRKAGEANKKKAKKEVQFKAAFPKHFDTEQFRTSVKKFQVGDLITLSEKLHGCVRYDTLVETLEYGSREIQEIVDNKLECHVQALDTKTNEIVWAKVDDWYFLADDGEWYEVELENGTKITITGNNPVWMPELNCYRKVEDLVVGDVLLYDD